MGSENPVQEVTLGPVTRRGLRYLLSEPLAQQAMKPALHTKASVMLLSVLCCKICATKTLRSPRTGLKIKVLCKSARSVLR